METDELIETLEEAGLSPYQADAYVALLRLGTASASEIAGASDVPIPRVYDVVRDLEDFGYVETFDQGSLRARAHSPTEVLEDLRGQAEQFEQAAEEVEKRWEQPEPERTQASIVSRLGTVLDRAEAFVGDADYRGLLSATPEHVEALRPALAAALDRGVSVYVSAHTAPDADPPPASLFESTATEARHRPIPAPFVALVDRERTCFAHHPDSYGDYGMLVDDRVHSYVFHWYFLTCLWEQYEPVHRTDSDPPRPYIDVRYCVRELHPLIEAGDRVRVRVEGYDRRAGDAVELTGRPVDAVYAPDAPGDDPASILRMAGQATLVVDTGEESLSVGGWGAVLEDVEATRITLVEHVPAGSEVVPDADTDGSVPAER